MVLGKEPLDELQAQAVACFESVPNLGVARPAFEPNPYGALGLRVNVVGTILGRVRNYDSWASLPSLGMRLPVHRVFRTCVL